MICFFIVTKNYLFQSRIVRAFFESNKKADIILCLHILSKVLGLIKLTKKQGI